jgi:hypothetical protein
MRGGARLGGHHCRVPERELFGLTRGATLVAMPAAAELSTRRHHVKMDLPGVKPQAVVGAVVAFAGHGSSASNFRARAAFSTARRQPVHVALVVAEIRCSLIRQPEPAIDPDARHAVPLAVAEHLIAGA